MCDFTRYDDAAIREHARATGGPSFVDRPFGCPPDTVLDLPVPPSVNATRKVDWRGAAKLNAWKAHADKLLMANGQFKVAQKGLERFEIKITLSEAKCKCDQDNVVKAAIDYLRWLGIILDDNPKRLRRTVVEWGEAPEGCRLIVRPCE